MELCDSTKMCWRIDRSGALAFDLLCVLIADFDIKAPGLGSDVKAEDGSCDKSTPDSTGYLMICNTAATEGQLSETRPATGASESLTTAYSAPSQGHTTGCGSTKWLCWRTVVPRGTIRLLQLVCVPRNGRSCI